MSRDSRQRGRTEHKHQIQNALKVPLKLRQRNFKKMGRMGEKVTRTFLEAGIVQRFNNTGRETGEADPKAAWRKAKNRHRLHRRVPNAQVTELMNTSAVEVNQLSWKRENR